MSNRSAKVAILCIIIIIILFDFVIVLHSLAIISFIVEFPPRFHSQNTVLTCICEVDCCVRFSVAAILAIVLCVGSSKLHNMCRCHPRQRRRSRSRGRSRSSSSIDVAIVTASVNRLQHHQSITIRNIYFDYSSSSQRFGWERYWLW